VVPGSCVHGCLQGLTQLLHMPKLHLLCSPWTTGVFSQVMRDGPAPPFPTAPPAATVPAMAAACAHWGPHAVCGWVCVFVRRSGAMSVSWWGLRVMSNYATMVCDGAAWLHCTSSYAS
jgi:hypothetical protein